jgi:hypothetical protein
VLLKLAVLTVCALYCNAGWLAEIDANAAVAAFTGCRARSCVTAVSDCLISVLPAAVLLADVQGSSPGCSVCTYSTVHSKNNIACRARVGAAYSSDT